MEVIYICECGGETYSYVEQNIVKCDSCGSSHHVDALDKIFVDEDGNEVSQEVYEGKDS